MGAADPGAATRPLAGHQPRGTRGAIMAPTLEGIRQIAITVSDVERAVGFYRDVLGLAFLFRAGPELAFLDAGGIRLMLTTPQGAGEAGCNSILYFTVADIASAHADLLARGAMDERAPALTARMPDHEVWTGFVRDPEGNLVGLMEERRQARPV
jgi:predicted enzyme related to lactoylglutathione lyase